MKQKLKNLRDLIVQPFKEWNEDHASELAAALAYYTIFSLSPLLVITLAIAGQFFNSQTVRSQMTAQIGSFMGPQTAGFIDNILQNSSQSSGGLFASIIGFIFLLIGASGVFNQLQYALDTVWEVPEETHKGLKSNIMGRVRSFLLVLVLGFLMMAFLILSGVASAVINSLGLQSTALPQFLNLVVLFGLMTVLFALVFRLVPASEIAWGDVWLGAAITSMLFVIGRFAISLYLSFSKSSSVFGAAGSLIVLLIWIYYSAQIFLLGAEFTQVYAKKFGSQQQRPVENNAPPAKQTGFGEQAQNLQ
jgi:membrane protein